jgi:hypothetical protein
VAPAFAVAASNFKAMIEFPMLSLSDLVILIIITGKLGRISVAEAEEIQRSSAWVNS